MKFMQNSNFSTYKVLLERSMLLCSCTVHPGRGLARTGRSPWDRDLQPTDLKIVSTCPLTEGVVLILAKMWTMSHCPCSAF